MVVRRRFANAYGWQVIDHMVEEHFSEKCCKGEDLSSWKIKKSDCNLIDLDEEEYRDLNVKLGQVMNKEYRKESKRHHINSPGLSVPERAKLKDLSHQNGVADSVSIPVSNVSNIDNSMNSDSNISDLDNESANNGAWLNEEASGYYDGPTGLLNSVNEGQRRAMSGSEAQAEAISQQQAPEQYQKQHNQHQRQYQHHQNRNHNQNQNQNQNQNRQQKKNTYAPKRGPIIDLEPVLNKEVSVRISGGREIIGTLAGYDQLMNLVVENAIVKTPDHISYSEKDEEIKLDKVVVIGRLLLALEPMDGYEVVTNPNVQFDFVI
ncbi:hypothetical protein PMKS-000571 [Pichia membranifaciens]|uniref:Sm domain-containing protein n=1 Tax=Pichia membranifaciens TaxID=4926 RepID=A0A1Q2YC45_9ASCO|nr:hypothetical protein PMKS-000571 [Pichia membranifaciens]